METASLPRHSPFETKRAAVMFFLALLFLIFLGGVLHRHRLPHSDPGQETPEQVAAEQEVEYVHEFELRVQEAGLGALYVVFWLEAILRFLRRDRSESLWRHLGHSLLVCLFPPFRMGTKSSAVPGTIWLPWWGWRVVDRSLFRDLERVFSIPMIFIALLVLPLLGIQVYWASKLDEYAGLHLFLEVGNALIWVAFALEFILLVSVAEKKLAYTAGHWIDLLIVLLPFVEFLPLARALRTVRLFRLLQLDKLLRLSGLYRFRGVYMRGWRAFLLLDLIRRLTGRSLQARLAQLEELLAAKEAEVEELRKEIADLKVRIAQEQAKADAARSDAAALEEATSSASEAPPPPRS
jgi:voltage-gated potassium channel